MIIMFFSRQLIHTYIFFLQKIHHISDAATKGHNLRSRSRRNNIETVNKQISHDLDHETNGDFLCDNEGLVTSIVSSYGILNSNL